MTNNDILRRLRYTFDFNDSKMIEIFKLGQSEISKNEISSLLSGDDSESFKSCNDKQLICFLDGLITMNRGVKEGAKPQAESEINNNIVFNKLKIALNLKAEDVLEILESVDFSLSKHELSALFRKSTHKHYRQCHDQILRNFLNGLQLKYRENKEDSDLH